MMKLHYVSYMLTALLLSSLFYCTAPASTPAAQDKSTTETQAQQTVQTDPVAENMLLYQREAGGWPKAVNGKAVNYKNTLTDAEKKATKHDYTRIDATIDNNATTREIKYLAKAYKDTKNQNYLAAAEKGVAYLLKAQFKDGGWPQFYPDTSGYRIQITYNDNAMVNVLQVLHDVHKGTNNMDVINSSYKAPAKTAVDKGVAVILKTQQKRNGKLTAWAAQYDRKTLQPAKARAYELPSIAMSESVGIVNFLMQLDNPSPAIKEAVKSAVAYMEESKIKGFKTQWVKDETQSSGRDIKLIEDKDAVIWGRFYELDTNRPFFSGRDGVKKYKLEEIENERRTGYAWYGTWPESVLNKYPAWAKKWGV